MRDNIKIGSRRLQKWLHTIYEEEKRVKYNSEGYKLK